MRTPWAWWWIDAEAGLYGLELPMDTNPEDVLKHLLWQVEGITIDLLTIDEINSLVSKLYFMQMHSVVKADYEQLGDDLIWHVDASGKRTRDAWWLNRELFDIIMGDVIRHRDPVETLDDATD